MAIDSLILKLPLLGNLMRKIGVARFTRTLGTLITSGVPMLEAMDITARTSGNAVIEKAKQYLDRVAHSMRLEAQEVSKDEYESQVAEVAEKWLRSPGRDLWSEK